MAIEITLDMNTGEFTNRALRITARSAQRAIGKTTQLIEAQAARNAPERSSNLVNSITSFIQGIGFQTEGTVRVLAFYGLYVHEGTGIYGPLKTPIFPRNKKALFWPGAAHPVKSVKGQPPNPFLKNAFNSEGPKLRQFIFND